MIAVPAAPSRCDGSGDAICSFPPCGKAFPRTKSTRRFCSEDCKAAFHDPENRRLRGTVTGNRILKGGDHSITIRVPASEDVSRLPPGAGAEIL